MYSTGVCSIQSLQHMSRAYHTAVTIKTLLAKSFWGVEITARDRFACVTKRCEPISGIIAYHRCKCPNRESEDARFLAMLCRTCSATGFCFRNRTIWHSSAVACLDSQHRTTVANHDPLGCSSGNTVRISLPRANPVCLFSTAGNKLPHHLLLLCMHAPER